MQRRKIGKLFNLVYFLLVKQCAFGENLTAVYNAVTDCRDFRNIRNDAVLLIRQVFEHKPDCRCVVGNVRLLFNVFFACALLEKSVVNADSVAQPLCQTALRLHVDALIFQR